MTQGAVSRLPLYKEPLLHFFIIGVTLFAVYALTLGPTREESDGTEVTGIVVGQAQLDHLIATWKQLWDREPTRQELTRLVNDYIREEVLYREAIALGLDRDDTIVRRRMAQKMAFLSRGDAPQDPTDGDLRKWFAKNQQRYEFPATVSFSHIYFSSEQRGPRATDDAKEVLAKLHSEATPPIRDPDRGDRFMTRYDFVSIGQRDLRNLFGDEFATRVFELKALGWHGPVESSYGQHLVYLSERTERHVPDFEIVRSRVEIDWMQGQIEATNRELLERLLKKYGLHIGAAVKSRLDGEVLIDVEG